MEKVSETTASPSPLEETKFHRGTLGLIQRFTQRRRRGGVRRGLRGGE